MRNHELKFRRAREHLEKFGTESEGWLEPEHYTVVAVPDPEPPVYGVWAYADPLPADPFSMLVGDFLYNIRAGLDYLAFELAEAHSGKLSKKVAEDSEFPIFGDKDGKGAARFNKAAKKKLAAVDPAACAFIESKQPYQLGASWEDDPLWTLYELARIDRHRFLHLAATQSKGLTINPRKSNAKILPGTIEVFGGAIEGSTQIGRLRLGAPDHGEMHVEFGPAPEIGFAADTPLVGGEEVTITLSRLFNYVGREIVNPLRERFLG